MLRDRCLTRGVCRKVFEGLLGKAADCHLQWSTMHHRRLEMEKLATLLIKR
jgi:hypothetical protein